MALRVTFDPCSLSIAVSAGDERATMHGFDRAPSTRWVPGAAVLIAAAASTPSAACPRYSIRFLTAEEHRLPFGRDVPVRVAVTFTPDRADVMRYAVRVEVDRRRYAPYTITIFPGLGVYEQTITWFVSIDRRLTAIRVVATRDDLTAMKKRRIYDRLFVFRSGPAAAFPEPFEERRFGRGGHEGRDRRR